MYNTLHADEVTITRKRFHHFVAVFGTACGAVSVWMSLEEIAKAFAAEPQSV